MPFPTFGTAIFAFSFLPLIGARASQKKLNDLKSAEPFPTTSFFSKKPKPGYYWIRGALDADQPVHITFNNGNLKYSYKCAIVKYDVFRIFETLNTIEKKETENEGQDDKKTETKKQSRWVKSQELVTSSPILCASKLKVNNLNIDAFIGLFDLEPIDSLFSESATLFPTDKSSATSLTNINLNLNLGGSSNRNDVVGDKERNNLGYKHVWKGCLIGKEYTVIGYWNGNSFVLGNKKNMVSRSDYDTILDNHAAWIGFWNGVAGIGFLSGVAVGFWEMYK